MLTNILMKTYIGKKGYTINLKDFTEEELCKIKNDLTFTPFQPKGYGPEPIPFSIFGISKNKMFLPKFYGITTFGNPTKNKISNGDNIKLKFNGSLRENQIEPVNACIKAANDTGGGILCLPCAWGKCLGINTPIMMYDGTIKMVQDVKTNDLLMGDDSTPRKVLSTCKGQEQMYKVIPKKGDPYIVNESHILSLKCSAKLKKGDIVDIPVKDYLSLQSSGKKSPLLGYRVPVNFYEKEVGFDPYIIGLWLGCGKKNTIISTQDAVIIQYLVKKLSKYNMYLQYDKQYDYNMNSVKYINPLITELEKQKLINNKHIPLDYKCNSRDIRLKILAGLIDSCGSKKIRGYGIVQKNEKLFDDILFISRSLGFAAYKSKFQKSYVHNGEKKIETYYRTIIYGKKLSDIPVLKRNQIEKKQIKDVLVSRIHLEKLEVGDYYGFEIDGNHRFVLGDFTVTHNTSISLYIIVELGVKALIIVNKEFLMDQWKERIQQFLPDAKIGILRQKKIDIENKDIVIAMLQSVAMCKYDSSIYDSFGITFYDEVHCVPSKIFSKALRKINTKYHFGLSATPNRADGMTKVTNLYIGPIIYKVDTSKSKKNPKNLHVFTIAFNKLPESKHYKSLSNYRGKPDVVKMISNLTECPKRLALISMILRYFIITDKRHILVLSDRIQYLNNIENKIKLDLQESGLQLPFKIGYYIGGMKEKERKESEKADLILASYSMAKEAMDIPILDTLLMVTSKSNIEQSIGRIQRQTVYPDERPPLVIDFVDYFSSFQSQFNKRKLFYKKNHYTISNFMFNEDINKLYTDFDEGIQNIINNNIEKNIEDIEDEDILESKTTNFNEINKSKINIAPCEINKNLFDIIGTGDFDI
jgi:superfamily II DNA or RNA helicase